MLLKVLNLLWSQVRHLDEYYSYAIRSVKDLIEVDLE